MTTLAIVQARLGSMRLKNKVILKVKSVPLILTLLQRLSYSKKIDKIVVATSVDKQNDELVRLIEQTDFDVFRGAEDDVLDRFYHAATIYSPDTVVRITGDCPLIDPYLVDKVVNLYKNSGCDYASNVNPPTFPDGLDVEVFSFAALKVANDSCTSLEQREHVTPFIRESGFFKLENLFNSKDSSSERWTVDEYEDFEVVKNVLEYFAPRLDFTWEEIMKLSEKSPELFVPNKHICRNEGLSLSSGQKLWKRAKKSILGGNMLLSKRPELHLPNKWPTYFKTAKGCRVTDIDGREYIDMYLMGVGTNILGYGHPEVDEAVKKVISNGNLSTLNCPEEVYLAEKLVEIHPWADMVKLARTGGEANAIAVRIARAAAGKEKIAICGYHGWHDWYLASNLSSSKNLNSHLLPGLDPIGVPEDLKGTIFPFDYNDFETLEELVSQHDIGVIKMEVIRNTPPKNNFLQKVRQLATEQGIVLIFDECTSGFRQCFGGIHKCYDVEPDMAVFGKTLGNGYAITAVIGRRSVMESAQLSFISSTFWTERIGPTAALATLKVMEREQPFEYINKTGKILISKWRDIADNFDLPINFFGIPSLSNFTFNSNNFLPYKTLITQEMLKKGYLASTAVYVSAAHTDEIIDDYIEKLTPVFELIRDCEQGGRDIYHLLDGPICETGFKRMN